MFDYDTIWLSHLTYTDLCSSDIKLCDVIALYDF